MLAGLLPRLASLASQPTVLAAGLATGVAVGAVGVGTGVIPVGDPAPRNTVLYECPGSGRVVTSIAPSQSVLVTARSADGQWLQIYVGAAGVERGWAPAAALQLNAAPDSLPVEDCTPISTPEPPAPTGLATSGATPGASPASSEPEATPTSTPQPTSTPRPSSPPTPIPTPTPSAIPTVPPGPVLSELEVTTVVKDPGTGTYVIVPLGCTGYKEARIQVRADDPDGVADVVLWFQPSGGALQSLTMTKEVGGPTGGIYSGVFGSDGTWGDGQVDYYIVASDSLGNDSTLHDDAEHIVELQYCSD